MNKIDSIDTLITLSNKVRNFKRGYVTNFYLDPSKHNSWIHEGVLKYWETENVVILVRDGGSFWNLYYIGSSVNEVQASIQQFVNVCTCKLIVDIVGSGDYILSIKKLFTTVGFCERKSLVRLSRLTPAEKYEVDSGVDKACKADITQINEYLHRFFDEEIEQIPYLSELDSYIDDGCILKYSIGYQIVGFVIYEKTMSTLYLRYWFTHPSYRNQKIGSKLLRAFFHEGETTKRQILWVITDNGNAIVRYEHYGFSKENMNDLILEKLV